nr:hypothetical protein [Tanacetum cinerariifolium]
MGRDTVQLETAGGCPLANGRGGILPNVIPNPWTRIRTGTIAFLGRQEGIPDRRGLADECSQGRDAGCGHILPRGCTGTGPPLKTTGDVAMFDMDLFNLIRAPNPIKVKVESRPRILHEVPLLTLTAPCVIKMDEPAFTDSSGVSSTIERSPLDFAHEARASDQGAAAPKIPSSEDVPATVASGAGQAKETATMDPSTAQRAGAPMGGSLTAIQLGLAFNVFVSEGAPTDVSDPDLLSFTDTSSRHPVDVKSSQGIATAGDPESENASPPAEVEQWCVELDARLDTLSIDFDEQLYPHMLTAIAGRRWVIGHGLRLAMIKCDESLEMRQAFADVVSAGVAKGMSEGLKHGVEHGQAQLKLEGLKDAPMDVIMATLYLESDTEGMPHNIYATSTPAPLSSPSMCI